MSSISEEGEHERHFLLARFIAEDILIASSRASDSDTVGPLDMFADSFFQRRPLLVGVAEWAVSR